MYHVAVDRDFDAWRTTARDLLAHDVPPDQIVWDDGAAPLPLLAANPHRCQAPPFRVGPASSASTVPKDFLPLARRVLCHRDPARFALLYRALWRLTHDDRHLFANPLDDDTRALELMDKSVRRDAHKMTAFVRFRRVDAPDQQGGQAAEHYVAWHRPEHFIVKLTADFFVKRFGNMRWSILTPDDSAHWDGQHLTFTPGVDRSQAPTGDDLERLWGTYYANIFNPARIKLAAMKKEMPLKYWQALPETQLIPDLLRDAPRRVETMMAKKIDEYPTAEAYMPARITLNTLKEAAAGCQGCPLYKLGTQTVFGEGAKSAKVVMLGEQPGDQEDRAGKPFVGPSGQLLDTALEEVGIDRTEVYVTNTVKHFKWEPRGTRRIHAKPNAREIQACKPWLTAELQVLKPQMVICLGATAAQALMGKEFRITKSRGEIIHDTEWAPKLLATVHPSSILRTPSEDRDAAYRAFVEDLRVAAKQLQSA
jgi:DNA polymerase